MLNPLATRGFKRAGVALAALTLATAALLSADQPAQAQRAMGVDVALVLAVDVSSSMDLGEQEIQRKGYSDAFRHPSLVNAIRSGPNGRIAVTYMEWAEQANQTVGWTIISNAADAKAFADKLDAAPIFSARRTSISLAISSAVTLLDESGVVTQRRVIDVSGDGANNSGVPVETARDEALAKGVVINGLPIMLDRGASWFDVPYLDAYYKDCVIGGPGSFSLPVKSITELQNTIRAKLVNEVAGLQPLRNEDMFQRAQARVKPPKTNCLIGEQRRGGGGGGNFQGFGNPPPFSPLPQGPSGN